MEEEKKLPESEAKTPVAKESEVSPKLETPKEKKYVPLEELIKERQRRRSLEDRLEAVERKVSENKTDAVRDIALELGVDDEAAKKLHAVLSKYSGQKSSGSNELQELSSKFQARVVEAAQNFDDWEDVKEDMNQLFNERYANDPKSALSQDPENYYYQAVAKRAKLEKEKINQTKELKEKAESQSLASVESGSGYGRPPKKNIWTRERIKSLSPDEYRKNLPEIQSALAKGELA